MDAHTGMMSTMVYGLSLIQHLHTQTHADVDRKQTFPKFYKKTSDINEARNFYHDERHYMQYLTPYGNKRALRKSFTLL